MRAVLLAFAVGLMSASALAQEKPQTNTSAQINYSGFRNLAGEVENYRDDRLVTLADFQRMAREPNTIVLDARSAEQLSAALQTPVQVSHNRATGAVRFLRVAPGTQANLAPAAVRASASSTSVTISAENRL